MHWLTDLLVAILGWFTPPQREDRSIVGKSREEQSSERFWTGCGVAFFILSALVVLWGWSRLR